MQLKELKITVKSLEKLKNIEELPNLYEFAKNPVNVKDFESLSEFDIFSEEYYEMFLKKKSPESVDFEKYGYYPDFNVSFDKDMICFFTIRNILNDHLKRGAFVFGPCFENISAMEFLKIFAMVQFLRFHKLKYYRFFCYLYKGVDKEGRNLAYIGHAEGKDINKRKKEHMHPIPENYSKKRFSCTSRIITMTCEEKDFEEMAEICGFETNKNYLKVIAEEKERELIQKYKTIYELVNYKSLKEENTTTDYVFCEDCGKSIKKSSLYAHKKKRFSKRLDGTYSTCQKEIMKKTQLFCNVCSKSMTKYFFLKHDCD